MRNKSLVGKKDGCNVFIEWELKDGNFSASGTYENKLGSDYVSCGQNLDEILEDFPDSEFVQSIHQVWKRWHLNDMRAGSPKQMELINTVIGPAYEVLKEDVSHYNQEYWKYKRVVLDKIKKAKHNVNQSEEGILKMLLESLPENLEQNKNYFRYIGAKEILKYSSSGEFKYVSITASQAKILREGPRKSPDYYTFVTQALEKRGRLVDPDYLVDGVAYKYGSRWLKEEIPADIIAVINSWSEVKAGETQIQKLAKKYIKNYTTVDRGKIKVTLISGATFDFTFGSAVTPTPEMMLDALIQDARYGQDGFEAALEECLGMGYDGKEAIRIAKALVKQYEKAVECGLFEEVGDEIN